MSSNTMIIQKKLEKRKLRKNILHRYNLTNWKDVRCIKCDQLASEENVMEIHHLEFVSEYANKASDTHNVVQICHNCHVEFHKYCKQNLGDTKGQFVQWLDVPLHYHMLKYVPRKTKWYQTFTGFNCHKVKGNKGIFYLVRSEGC